jgi:hypothetical protein
VSASDLNVEGESLPDAVTGSLGSEDMPELIKATSGCGFKLLSTSSGSRRYSDRRGELARWNIETTIIVPGALCLLRPMCPLSRRPSLKVVDTPFGKRPFRSAVDPAQDGAEVVNAVSDRVRAELLRRIGLGDLLTPRDSRSPIAQRGVMRVAPCILVEPGSVMLWPSKFIGWKKLKLHFGGRVRARC